MSPRPLELSLSADAVGRLRRHPLLAALTEGRPRRVREHAVYFDTADLALARVGVEVCVRRVGRRTIQTVTWREDATASPSDAVLPAAVADAREPDLARITDPVLRALVAERSAGRVLTACYELELARETRLLREDSNEVVFSLAAGELRTARGLEPVGQLVLTSRSGDPAGPAELALELLDSVPMRPAWDAPAARARRLLLGEAARPSKAERVEVAEHATLEDLLVAVADGCLCQITRNEAPAADGVDPEGVHQLRVGARRLRSALAFFGAAIPERQRAALRAELAWLGGELGPARDLDVFATEWLGPIRRSRPDVAVLERLGAELELQRAASYERVRRALGSQRYTRLVLELHRWLARRAWREQALSETSATLFQPAREHAARALERRHRKARKLARGIAKAPAAKRHALRIQLKKLRYAAEFSASLFPGRQPRRYARRLASLQDGLGAGNDAVVAERIAAELAAKLGGGSDTSWGAGLVAGWAGHASAHGQVALRAQWKRFRRVGRFWPKPPKRPHPPADDPGGAPSTAP